MQCLYIDVYNPAFHALLGDAQAARKRFAPAVSEYETALTLKPRRPNEIKVKLARAEFGLGDKAVAAATLDAVLKADPENPEAKALKGEWK